MDYVSVQDTTQPIMCSYKLVNVRFDVWGLSQRVESFVHKVSETLLVYKLYRMY